MESLSTAEREAKTHRQIAMVDEQLTREFSVLSADVVHREVASVSEGLLADARFSDHVAVLTGRYAAEHLQAGRIQAPETGTNISTARRTTRRTGWFWPRLKDRLSRGGAGRIAS